MIWLNKYHRGFNRLWLVFTCFPFFIFLLYLLLSEDYKANRYVQYHRRVANFGDLRDKRISEDIIAAWVQEQWRKDKPWKGEITTEQKVVEDLDEIKELWELWDRDLSTPEDRFKRRIVRSVRSMKEAKSFTDKELTTIIDLAVEAEKTYPLRARKARWRAAGHLLVGFIVFIAIFGFGHGVFCLIVWIVRGFRET